MNVILIGASVRAAAASAVRAGLRPTCVDLFADRDLQILGPTIRAHDYPHGILAALEGLPRYPVAYTGGFENHGRLLAQLGRTILGNDRYALRRVRVTRRLMTLLRDNGWSVPEVRANPPHDGGRWLLKPRFGSGGCGIREYSGQPIPADHILQQFIDGLPCSAVFVGNADAPALLLGVTQQLIGPGLNAPPFHYVGSVGPLTLTATTRAAWQRIGDILANAGLRGLFGVDAVLHDGVPWPIEVNPRYTASIEILERGLEFHAFALHRSAFVTPDAPLLGPIGPPRRIWGKAIVYARKALVFPATGPWDATLAGPAAALDAAFGDIPAAGEPIAAGQPVLTVFASASTVAECLARLQENVAALDRWLGPL